MSFEQCIANGVEGGFVDPDEAAEIIAQYNDLASIHGKHKAKEQLQKKYSEDAFQARRVVELQVAAQRELTERLDNGLNPTDLVEGIHGAGGKTLRGRYEGYRGLLRAEMNDVLRTFRSNLVGERRNKATLTDMVHELFNENTGNGAAKELAGAFHRAAELARELFNARGGNIKKLKDWGLPQSHSQIKIGRVDAKEWVAFILPLLRKGSMVNSAGDSLTEAELIKVLLKMHETIATDGASSGTAKSGFRAGKALKNTRLEHRHLHFENAKSWLEYQERFGEDDPWRTMVQHIDSMAHDIAHMDVLGPNQDAMWQYVKDYTQNKADLTKDPVKKDAAGKLNSQADAMRAVWTGEANKPSDRLFARSMSGLRQYLTSAQLGSAVISSVTDFGNQRVAAGFVGLSKTGHLKFMTKLITSKQFREEAGEMGLILQNAVDMGQAAMRYSMEDFHVESAGRLADGVLRVSGLSGLTQMQRDSFGMSVMNDLSKKVGQTFDELDPKLQSALEAFNIKADDWEKMRTAKLYDVQGMTFLRPKEIQEVAGIDVALNFMEFMSMNREFAVPSKSIKVEAGVKGRSGTAGTFVGELARSVAQYKSFPLIIALTHIGRVVKEMQEGRKAGALQYAVSMLFYTTLLGAVAIQAKSVAAGKNPDDMDSFDFWGKAILQGGGLGIFGDFLSADKNRYGGSLAETLAGPTIGLAADALDLTVGNAKDAIEGKDLDLGADAFKFVSDNLPGQNLWFTRLAYEREIEDQILSILDPKFKDKTRRKVRRQNKEAGGYFWKPNDSVFD